MDYPNDQAPGAPVRSGVPEHGRVPKYYAVKARRSALVDTLAEGEVLPTEREPAVRHEVSRETVRQALRDLLLEGRLWRQGRGTVVAGPKLEQPLSLAGYTEGVRRQGRTPGRRLVGLDRFPCPAAPLSGVWAGAGFVRPAAGRVHLGGRDVTGLPPHRRGIGHGGPAVRALPAPAGRGERRLRPAGPRKAPKAETRDRVTEALTLVGMEAYAPPSA